MAANRRPAARFARRRRFALLLAAPLVLVAGGAVAAAPGPRPAREAVLTTTTRVTWTGTKGFVLRVPRAFEVPPYAARLHLHRGTYAFVRRSSASCRVPPCGWGALDLLRGVGSDDRYGPGTSHWARFDDDDHVVQAGTYHFYLFTDGEATLEYDRTGLPGGTTAYRATGRIHGAAERLPVTCGAGLPGCTTTDGHGKRLYYGGRARDVGRAGSADVIVGTTQRKWIGTVRDHPYVSMLHGCAFPSGPSDSASPDPARHPRGCDGGGDGTRGLTDDAYAHAAWAVSGAGFATSRWVDAINPRAAGRVYLGYQVGVPVDTGDVEVAAWGVWFGYGVR